MTSVTELVKLVHVQGEAIKVIELGTNEMISPVESGVVGLKADTRLRPSNPGNLPGLQTCEIVGTLD
jgi:hypothetical protein